VLRNWLIIPLLIVIAGTTVLNGAQVPCFIDWRSSYGTLFYNIAHDETSSLAYLYKVTAGIDTVFANGLGTRLVFTNEEKGLFSQVLLKQAIVSYRFKDNAVELAMKDTGYGDDFQVFNRRNDDILFGRNALVEYRWNGITYVRQLGISSISAGFGTNIRNGALANLEYRFKKPGADITLFGYYVQNDSQNTLQAFNSGTEARLTYRQVELHSAFSFRYVRKHKTFPAESSWHLINELKFNITTDCNVSLSSALSKDSENNILHDTDELCLITRYSKINSKLGIKTQSLPAERGYTYFLDLCYNPINTLMLGTYFDYVDPTRSDNYYRIGIQTSYTLR
jgi:hypothetical protein